MSFYPGKLKVHTVVYELAKVRRNIPEAQARQTFLGGYFALNTLHFQDDLPRGRDAGVVPAYELLCFVNRLDNTLDEIDEEVRGHEDGRRTVASRIATSRVQGLEGNLPHDFREYVNYQVRGTHRKQSRYASAFLQPLVPAFHHYLERTSRLSPFLERIGGIIEEGLSAQEDLTEPKAYTTLHEIARLQISDAQSAPRVYDLLSLESQRLVRYLLSHL